jgi:hypothetical protein
MANTEAAGCRWVGLNDLKKAVRDAQSAIFTSAYVVHCGYEKYLKMVRRQYLPRRVNIPNLESPIGTLSLRPVGG